MDRLEELINKIQTFREERNWKQYHTPSNLAKSIMIEAGELLECFQWNENDFDCIHVKEEIADVFIYTLLFADAIDEDIIELAKAKLIKNAEKYPITKSYNNAKKYNQF